MYPSPAYQPPMLPPPVMTQPYTPTPPMGMTPFASSVDPLMMQRGLGPPFAPGGTPLDMMPPMGPMGPPPPPPYMPGYMPQQLSCWRDCTAW
ncbi:hypothetical protein BJV82DRAFT_669391 [Fennellomyces sp. T-0311]|nr:hypothetical protein BJV82DRAFT_669391 [Fennellomyces sp. T-0311]